MTETEEYSTSCCENLLNLTKVSLDQDPHSGLWCSDAAWISQSSLGLRCWVGRSGSRSKEEMLTEMGGINIHNKEFVDKCYLSVSFVEPTKQWVLANGILFGCLWYWSDLQTSDFYVPELNFWFDKLKIRLKLKGEKSGEINSTFCLNYLILVGTVFAFCLGVDKSSNPNWALASTLLTTIHNIHNIQRGFL